MTSSNSDHDPADDGIRDGLRRLPMSATPGDVASRVRGRLRRRRILKMAIALAPVIMLVTGLLVWRPWVANENAPPPPEIALGTAKPLEPDELMALFAAPPVDSLAILVRRDQVSVAALNRLEAKE